MSILDREGIVNEAKLHEIAKIIDNDFFMESIKEQIFAGLDCNPTDYLKEFNIKLKYIVENYDENDYESIIEYRDELYRNIILWIQDKYDVTVRYDEDEVAKISKQLYKFFAIDLKEAMTAFFFYYIIENYESILKNTDDSQLNKSQINDDMADDHKSKILLLSNLGVVFDSVIDMNNTFDTFIQYASMGGDIRSVNELKNALEQPEDPDNVSESVLSIDSEESMFESVMRDLRNNEFDHNIMVQVGSMLTDSLNLDEGENVNGKEE